MLSSIFRASYFFQFIKLGWYVEFLKIWPTWFQKTISIDLLGFLLSQGIDIYIENIDIKALSERFMPSVNPPIHEACFPTIWNSNLPNN